MKPTWSRSYRGAVVVPCALAACVFTGCASSSGSLTSSPPGEPDTEWRAVGGPRGGRVYEIARDPDDPNHLWVAGSTRELFESFDFGETWESIPLPEHQGLWYVRADVEKSGAIYSDHETFSRSDDGGRSWQPLACQFEKYRDLELVVPSQHSRERSTPCSSVTSCSAAS